MKLSTNFMSLRSTPPLKIVTPIMNNTNTGAVQNLWGGSDVSATYVWSSNISW